MGADRSGEPISEAILEHAVGIDPGFLLSGLVIASAEDHDVALLVTIDPHIVEWIRGIGPDHLFRRPLRQPRGDGVGGVEGQLRLKERRAEPAAVALQGHVSGDDDPIIDNAMPVRDDVVASELAHPRVFVDPRADHRGPLHQTRQILSWMEFHLIGKTQRREPSDRIMLVEMDR